MSLWVPPCAHRPPRGGDPGTPRTWGSPWPRCHPGVTEGARRVPNSVGAAQVPAPCPRCPPGGLSGGATPSPVALTCPRAHLRHVRSVGGEGGSQRGGGGRGGPACVGTRVGTRVGHGGWGGDTRVTHLALRGDTRGCHPRVRGGWQHPWVGAGVSHACPHVRARVTPAGGGTCVPKAGRSPWSPPGVPSHSAGWWQVPTGGPGDSSTRG